MRTYHHFLRALLFPLAALLPFTFLSCESLFEQDPAEEDTSTAISLSFDRSSYCAMTRAAPELPDTNNFSLRITSSSGETLYDGLYGNAPEKIAASPGSYNIEAFSSEFKTPCFGVPSYGDTRVLTVRKGVCSSVTLNCSQLNCGVKLQVSSDFLTCWPESTLHVKSSAGSLLYAYTEDRVAYFPPGDISLIRSEGARDYTLITRNLQAAYIWLLSVSIPEYTDSPMPPEEEGSGSIRIVVDTTRVYVRDDCIIGRDGNTGNSMDTALSVAEARSAGSRSGVWVYGYIAGGDLSSSGCSFAAPFKSSTNIVLAPRKYAGERGSCLSVQLARGSVRDSLNLVDHPGNLGRRVYLKGDLVGAYYGLPGIKNITEYEIEQVPDY